MRLGAPVFEEWSTPVEWVAAVKGSGYSACYCPVDETADDDVVSALRRAAEEADLVIAEVGAWSNPISPDEETRREAMELCTRRLDLADRIGARCCVNIAGSRGEVWDGPHPDNLTADTFDLIVDSVRMIIDAVRPKRAAYALETMPWVFPDSPDSYLRLIEAIDRDAFAVHLDPVNLVSSPQRYFHNAALIRDCFEKLGPHVRSCHAKDIVLSPELTVHLDEAPPGKGGLDYGAFLKGVEGAGSDVPVMLEHLPTAEAYREAADYVRSAAHAAGVRLR
ncbi:MAG: sugar phosphate isomerase/epimerase family protein [Candidatus Brocadiaceae bacterium]|jgi:sugar phosphate isomerase/epimerase